MKLEAINNYEVNDIGINLDNVKMTDAGKPSIKISMPVEPEVYIAAPSFYSTTIRAVHWLLLVPFLYALALIIYTKVSKTIDEEKKTKILKRSKKWFIITLVFGLIVLLLPHLIIMYCE